MAANAQSAARPVTPSADDAAADGPVSNVINKRLRALRKKSYRIVQMEESVAQGKVLNKEQEEVLRSKTVVLAQIEELEKLKQPLAAAVTEEHVVAVKTYLESEADKEKEARVLDEEVEVEEVKDQKDEREDGSVIEVVGDVLKLIYFGSIFDVKTQNEFTSLMMTRTLERGCCLTYDYVTDEAVDVLAEEDLDFISQLGRFLTSRPMDSTLSHKDALERCLEHAKLWLTKSEEPIGSDTSITYAGMRNRLNKIMASDYFTITPEIKAPVDVAAAAAAAGNYGSSYQAPAQGPNVTGQSEGGVSQYEHQDDGGHYQQDNGDNELSHTDEAHKEELAQDQYEVSSEQGQGGTQSDEQNQKNTEQYVQRRGYHQNQGVQNHRGGRGGGRRGSNGRGFRGGSRGGGPYQNGHNQYYEQPENYYPRNSYNGRGRSTRGRGGHGYNQYGASGHGSHPVGDFE